MFFIASKVLGFFLIPSNVLFMLLLVGVALLLARRHRTGKAVIVIATALLGVAAFSPLGLKLTGILESRFSSWDFSRGAPAGFIVLGGAVNPAISAQRRTVSLDGSAERLTIVAELARKYPDARFIYSGGNGGLLGGPAEADYVLPLFESFGIPAGRVTLERQSRTTYENATCSKEIAAPKPGERWVIVTSAAHMPRAVGAFRAAGFDVEAFPVDWQTGTQGAGYVLFGSMSAGLGFTDYAVREFVGLLAYRLSGRSSELFPAPR